MDARLGEAPLLEVVATCSRRAGAAAGGAPRSRRPQTVGPPSAPPTPRISGASLHAASFHACARATRGARRPTSSRWPRRATAWPAAVLGGRGEGQVAAAARLESRRPHDGIALQASGADVAVSCCSQSEGFRRDEPRQWRGHGCVPITGTRCERRADCTALRFRAILTFATSSARRSSPSQTGAEGLHELAARGALQDGHHALRQLLARRRPASTSTSAPPSRIPCSASTEAWLAAVRRSRLIDADTSPERATVHVATTC